MPDLNLKPSDADGKSPYIDIREDDLLVLPSDVLKTLLLDHSTGKNIFWATHDYESLGPAYDYYSEILPELITGKHGMVIRPRVLKSKENQTDRSKDMAEVFTPAWVVKKMVEYIAPPQPSPEVEGANAFLTLRCLELTCGEAPFLVSRYDATTGASIAINERVGMLDRKLGMINSQQLNDDDWLVQVRQAFQTTYGYEWQGDSLLLARENLLYTFVDYYEARFGSKPDVTLIQDFAEIISWNLWQMDGLTYRTPREQKEEPQVQLSLFEEPSAEPPAPLCVVMDWRKGKPVKVNSMKRKQTKNQDIMKFDVIIGNPPYQEEVEGTSDSAIYNYFMDEAYKNGNKVELITPARWLFNAGKTKKEWNKKMLSDKHLKVLLYEADSSKIFPNTNINGGLAVTYRNSLEEYGAINSFIVYNELRSIKDKTRKFMSSSISDIVSSPESYKFTSLLHDEHSDVESLLSSGHKYDVTSNAFEKLKGIVFFDERPHDGKIYIQMFGLENTKRCKKWVKQEYIGDNSGTLNKWKVLVSKANGASGTLAEAPARMISNPVVIEPSVGFTQTFISIGCFDTQIEAINAEKYVRTKFARALLGILKITQDCRAPKWKYVPLQDFTSSSDIDWSKSIAEIDEQLFDKYGLDEQERNFIRTKVKEMV